METALRYEYKMTAHKNMLPDVLSLIRHHRAVFRRQYPNRVVNNIYFDTLSLSSYLDHISGSARREKKRIRWYGTPKDIIENPVLERKMKIGQVGDKIIDALKPLKLDTDGPWPIPGKALTQVKEYQDAIHWRLHTVHPVVALRYERNYFISADNKYRLTVDTNLEYFGISPTGTPEARSVLPAPIIIELKYETEHADDASTITNGLPFRLDRFSKYIFAIEGLRKNS